MQKEVKHTVAFESTMGPDDILLLPPDYYICERTSHAMASGIRKVWLPAQGALVAKIEAVDLARGGHSKVIGPVKLLHAKLASIDAKAPLRASTEADEEGRPSSAVDAHKESAPDARADGHA